MYSTYKTHIKHIYDLFNTAVHYYTPVLLWLCITIDIGEVLSDYPPHSIYATITTTAAVQCTVCSVGVGGVFIYLLIIGLRNT